MTIARSQLVDPELTRWYHCISRCVRRAFLLAEGEQDRKLWIEKRLQELAEIFAVSVAGFAILDNHLHVLLRLDPQRAAAWSNEEVVRRWAKLYPPRDKKRQPLSVSQDWVHQQLKDEAWVAKARERLGTLGWFMKALKEPLAKLVNREERATGAFLNAPSLRTPFLRLTKSVSKKTPLRAAQALLLLSVNRGRRPKRFGRRPTALPALTARQLL